MVREYKRKTSQQSWREESMKAAIMAVRSGNIGYQAAADLHGVPLATLYRRVKSNKCPDMASKHKLGRFIPTFTVEQEKQLKDHILLMEKRLFGLTIKDFRSLAFQFAEMNSIPNNFSKETRLAGRDWVSSFLKRNPEISLRQPENTSAARASAFNRNNVKEFFKLLGDLMDKFHFPPSCIYNCDETGMTTVPNKPSKILSLKGKKQVGTLATSERGTLVTAEICFNATGHYVPPFLIFPRMRRNPIFEIGLPPESMIDCHPSGWMQSEIFAPTWFNHFLKHSKPSPERPVLLIMDGHSTHVKNLNLVELARQNSVHILIIPPHTSHRLQPLDVSFMFPLSTYYEQEVRSWLRNNPGKVVTINNVGSLFGKAYQRAATTQNAISGFKNTGICPFDPHIFADDLFEPAETTNRDISSAPSDSDKQDGNGIAEHESDNPLLLEQSCDRIPSPIPGPSRKLTPSPVPGPSGRITPPHTQISSPPATSSTCMSANATHQKRRYISSTKSRIQKICAA